MFFSPLELHTWLLSPNLMLLFIHGLKKKAAAVDIFSCEDSIPDNFIERIQSEFHAESHKKQIVIRYI